MRPNVKECKICLNLLVKIENLEDDMAELKRRYSYVAYPWHEVKRSDTPTSIPIRRVYDGRYPSWDTSRSNR